MLAVEAAPAELYFAETSEDTFVQIAGAMRPIGVDGLAAVLTEPHTAPSAENPDSCPAPGACNLAKECIWKCGQ